MNRITVKSSGFPSPERMREAFAAAEWGAKTFSVDNVTAIVYEDHIAYEGIFPAAALKDAPPEYGDN